MSPLLASWHTHHGWFWFWPFIPLFWLFVVFFCFRFFFWRRPWHGRSYGYRGHDGHDPRAILAERYARGEIDHEEYRERLGNLQD